MFDHLYIFVQTFPFSVIFSTLMLLSHMHDLGPDLSRSRQSHCGREHDRGQSYVIVGDRARSYDDRTCA